MFTIKPNPASFILEVECSGFWSMEDTDSFIRDFKVAADDLRNCTDRLNIIMDGSDCAVQSSAVMEKLNKFYQSVLRCESDKIAIIARSTLLKMQTERLLNNSKIRGFTSIDEARAWLSSCAMARA